MISRYFVHVVFGIIAFALVVVGFQSCRTVIDRGARNTIIRRNNADDVFRCRTALSDVLHAANLNAQHKSLKLAAFECGKAGACDGYNTPEYNRKIRLMEDMAEKIAELPEKRSVAEDELRINGNIRQVTTHLLSYDYRSNDKWAVAPFICN